MRGERVSDFHARSTGCGSECLFFKGKFSFVSVEAPWSVGGGQEESDRIGVVVRSLWSSSRLTRSRRIAQFGLHPCLVIAAGSLAFVRQSCSLGIAGSYDRFGDRWSEQASEGTRIFCSVVRLKRYLLSGVAWSVFSLFILSDSFSGSQRRFVGVVRSRVAVGFGIST